jgi:hypothetical protein
MNVGRENILERVRIALRVEAHRPLQATAAPIWPPIGDLETRFRSEFEVVKGEVIPTAEELREFLGKFSHVVTDGSDLARQAVGAGNADVRSCDLAVTACDCLVAQTGSIVVSTRSAGGRALSVLPPVHLVIACRDQVVADLAGAFTLLRKRYGQRWPSSLSFITGPSRTADIEKILVLGAHGPKRLALYFAS